MYGPQMAILPGVIVLEHQKPIEGETLAEYAHRFSRLVDISRPFVLIGSSLGGMLAIEMARTIRPEKVILISSVKHRGELPGWMRSMKYLRLHKLLTGQMFVRFSNSNLKRLITKRDPEVARLLIEMHQSADPDFVSWAINAVVNWDGKETSATKVIHLHGTRDLLFPHTHVRDAILVKGGSHVMGLTHAQAVNKLLLEILS